VRSLPQQEQATEQQHQVTAADADAEDVEEVGLEAHDPAEREQQQQARDHGEAQAQAAGLVAHVGGQAADQDGDEDDVVNAEDDFQGGQHRKGDPDVGVEQEFHEGRSEAFGKGKRVAQRAKPATITHASSQVNANFRLKTFSKN
jgi:hypothetical protein